jgi:hypothetical protein
MMTASAPEQWNSFQIGVVQGLSDIVASSQGRCKEQAAGFRDAFEDFASLFGILQQGVPV